MNRGRLILALSALTGQRVPISTTSAPLDAANSTVLDVRGGDQATAPKVSVELRRNVTYATRTGRKGKPLPLRLDVQVPRQPGLYPLVVYLTGGGFAVSPKQSALHQRSYLAAHGFVVASIQYRTTRDGAIWRDGVADVKSAIRFLRANAVTYQIDEAKVGVWGESAGGYLALMAGATNGESEFEGADNSQVSSEISAVLDDFGGSDLSRLADGFDDAALKANNAPGYGIAKYLFGPDTSKSVLDDPELVALANPINHLHGAIPAFLFFSGTDDRIISPLQTQLPHQALLGAKATSTRYLLDGAGHGDLTTDGAQARLWTTKRVLDLVVDFFRTSLS
jgi:acetyl esterase/lipase